MTIADGTWLDESPMVQWDRTITDGLLDFRRRIDRTSQSRRVIYCDGGPYDGKYAYVTKDAVTAFVVGDYSYDAPRHRHKDTGIWKWTYDELA